MGIHQFVDNLVLGLLLRFLLTLREDALAHRLAELLHRAVIAQILRELVVQFGQVLLAKALQNRVEPHGPARQALPGVISRIRDFKILLFAGRDPAQVLGKGLEGVLGAELEHQFVGLDRFAFHPGGAYQRNHGEIAVSRRARVYVDMLRLLLTDFLDAFVHVFVGDGRLVVGNFHVFVLAESDLRHHFKHRLEA